LSNYFDLLLDQTAASDPTKDFQPERTELRLFPHFDRQCHCFFNVRGYANSVICTGNYIRSSVRPTIYNVGFLCASCTCVVTGALCDRPYVSVVTSLHDCRQLVGHVRELWLNGASHAYSGY